MKKLIVLALLCCIGCTPSTPIEKMPTINIQENSSEKQNVYNEKFHQYDNENSFKGIKFGSSFKDVNKILELKEDYTDLLCSLKIFNIYYLKFNNLQFQSGYVYVENDKFCLVKLTIDNTIPNSSHGSYDEDISEQYKSIENSLTNLFGNSDYTSSTLKSWIGSNIEINLVLSVYVYDSKRGYISLEIKNKKLEEERGKMQEDRYRKIKVENIKKIIPDI